LLSGYSTAFFLSKLPGKHFTKPHQVLLSKVVPYLMIKMSVLNGYLSNINLRATDIALNVEKIAHPHKVHLALGVAKRPWIKLRHLLLLCLLDSCDNITRTIPAKQQTRGYLYIQKRRAPRVHTDAGRSSRGHGATVVDQPNWAAVSRLAVCRVLTGTQTSKDVTDTPSSCPRCGRPTSRRWFCPSPMAACSTHSASRSWSCSSAL